MRIVEYSIQEASRSVTSVRSANSDTNAQNYETLHSPISDLLTLSASISFDCNKQASANLMNELILSRDDTSQ